MMKKCFVSLVFLILILVPSNMVSSRHISRSRLLQSHNRHKLPNNNEAIKSTMTVMRRGADTVQVAGSRLPDCAHACGSCAPCRLVMVSFVCATIEEAETCPMAYKCMCKNKSYPIP